MNEWIFTTIAGFERELEDVLKTGVEHSSRARLTTALGRPGALGGSAMPKCRQQSLDLQTAAFSGRPCFSRTSAGMSLYCDGLLGSAAQAGACLAQQGPDGILPAHQRISVGGGKEGITDGEGRKEGRKEIKEGRKEGRKEEHGV